MKNNKHTPGPWKLMPTSRGSHEIANEDKIVITEIHDTETNDARLIAAAPEMLEALKRVVEKLGPLNLDGEIFKDELKDLIRKVRGES